MPYGCSIKERTDLKMAAVTSAMVKELRERTSAGMMDCKKALVESDGDMDKAIEWPIYCFAIRYAFAFSPRASSAKARYFSAARKSDMFRLCRNKIMGAGKARPNKASLGGSCHASA